MDARKPKHGQPIKPSSNLLKISELNLGDKVDLMKDSVFGSLSSVTNKRESSGTLVEALCNYYNASRKLFVLDSGAVFEFCSKEVADILGMEDTGIDYEEFLQQCSHLNAKFPSYVSELRTKFVSGAKRETITSSDLKEILSKMCVDDDESKQQFRKLMSYYLIEQVLLCGPNHKIPRQNMWRLVDDLDACEKVNWAKATMNHLHFSLSKVKTWIEGGASGQHLFSGATPVLETIIYDRISSMRPSTWSGDPHPPIQKYKAQRKPREWFERKLSELTSSTGIEECLHCTVSSGSLSSVEKTPEQSVDTVVVEELRDLSLSSIGGEFPSQDTSDILDSADPKIHAQNEDISDPFAQTRSLSQIFNMMDRFIDNPFMAASRGTGLGLGGRRGWDAKETDDALSLRFDMPGLDKQNVKISVEENTLIIKAEAEKEAEDEEPRRYSSRIDLPVEAYKLDEVKAEMKNGVLKIVVPKVKMEERKNVWEVEVK